MQVRNRNRNSHQKSIRVNRNVTFSPFDFFVPVIAFQSYIIATAQRVAINDTGSNIYKSFLRYNLPIGSLRILPTQTAESKK